MRESRRTGVGEPAPASLRVANPRQGDFAKPDCENEGRRPAFPPTLLTSEQTDRSSPEQRADLVMLLDGHLFFARLDPRTATTVCRTGQPVGATIGRPDQR